MYKTSWSRLDLIIIPLVKVFIRDVQDGIWNYRMKPMCFFICCSKPRVGDYQKASVMSSLDGGNNYVFKIDEEF
ncbi:hypothetical protein AAG906_007397 [Vitis piasezkii]